MTQKSRLNGKRGVPLLRCSTMEQADTSIDDQLNSIEAFAKKMDMQLGEADRLSNEGIGLAEADGYIEDRGTADLARVIKAEAAKRQAMSISDASARGSQSSLQGKRRSHSVRPAFGIDKLYLDSDGKERIIIRRLKDGSSVEIDPATGDFGVRFAKGVRGYRKGSLDRDTLVHGDPQDREVILRIFQMKHLDGFGGTRIARILNDECVASANGG